MAEYVSHDTMNRLLQLQLQHTSFDPRNLPPELYRLLGDVDFSESAGQNNGVLQDDSEKGLSSVSAGQVELKSVSTPVLRSEMWLDRKSVV